MPKYLGRAVLERFEQLAFLYIGNILRCAIAVFQNRPDTVDGGFDSDRRAYRSREASALAEIQKNLASIKAREVDPIDIGFLRDRDWASEGED